MLLNKNFFFYACAGLLFIGCKLFYMTADTVDLLFLLTPTNACVSLFTGASFLFIPEKGYFYEALHMVINKSCSGFNFWMLCFMAFVFITIPQVKRIATKAVLLPALLGVSFICTIFVNAARIVTILYLNHFLAVLAVPEFTWIHEATGAFIYLFSLLGFYLLLYRFFNKRTNLSQVPN